MLLRLLIVTATALCLRAQAPVDKAWDILSQASKDSSFAKRSKAVGALGMIPENPRAQSIAEVALDDEREEVRTAAAEALGAMRASGSAEKLKALILKEKESSVIFAVANALFLMGDPAAYQVYYAVLTGQKKSGDALIESQVKMLKDPKALTKMGVEAGIGFVPFGGVSYTAFKMVTKDSVSPVRAAVATKLANDPDPKTAQALADATKDPKWIVRAAVAGTIGLRKDPAMLEFITPLLDDENEVVRFNAAAAVIRLSALRN
jgi:HEAT repeat protein